MEKSAWVTPIMFGALFYTQNLYVPLYLIIINVHPERGYIPSRRPLNKPIIVSNNFRRGL